MVCHRCKMVVSNELQKLGLHPLNVTFGEVIIEEKELDQSTLDRVTRSLEAYGFELIDDKRTRIIQKIKNFIIDTVHNKDEQPAIKFSTLISQHLMQDYSFLSNLFSEVEGITIGQYIILQKIEKVKELLLYDELPVNDISYRMGYSSAAHLSMQFKKITGLTPLKFRLMGSKFRKSLDDVGVQE